jgi:hypothetical protein
MNKKQLLTLIVFIFAIAGALAWITFNDLHQTKLTLTSRAEGSPVIVYAVVKRNEYDISLVIQDVWKDTRKSNSILIGKTLHLSPFGSSHIIPDGAVVYYEQKLFDPGHFVPGSISFVQDGEVEGLSLAEYKKAVVGTNETIAIGTNAPK